MTALAHTPSATEVQAADARCWGDDATARLSLRATEDGWSLITPGGQVVYRGFGLAGRRQCLQFARDHGVLAVTS